MGNKKNPNITISECIDFLLIVKIKITNASNITNPLNKIMNN